MTKKKCTRDFCFECGGNLPPRKVYARQYAELRTRDSGDANLREFEWCCSIECFDARMVRASLGQPIRMGGRITNKVREGTLFRKCGRSKTLPGSVWYVHAAILLRRDSKHTDELYRAVLIRVNAPTLHRRYIRELYCRPKGCDSCNPGHVAGHYTNDIWDVLS